MTQWALEFVATDGDGDGILDHLLYGQQYIPREGTPACGVVVDLPAERATDGHGRRLVCDKPVDHVLSGDHRHRQVTDLSTGHSTTWRTLDAEDKAAELFDSYQRTRHSGPA